MKNKKTWVIVLCAILVAMMIIGPVAGIIATLFA